MADITYKLEYEIATNSYMDITGDLIKATIERKVGDLFNNLNASDAAFTVNNYLGTYSPEKTDSPLFGTIYSSRGIRMSATYSGCEHRLFTGFIDDINVTVAGQESTVTISARDEIRKVADATISTELYTDTRVHSIFDAVLGSLGVQSYQISQVYDTSPFTWFDERDGLGALRELIRAGNYHAYVDKNGVFQLKSRYWDQEGVGGGSVVASYSDTASGYLSINYQYSDANVYNDVAVRGTPRYEGSSGSVVAELINFVRIDAGQSKGIFLNYIDPETFEPLPATGVYAPDKTPPGSDFIIRSTAVSGIGTIVNSACNFSSRAFAQSVVSTITNFSGARAWVQILKFRGTPLRRGSDQTGEFRVSSSQTQYGTRTFTTDANILATTNYLNDFAQYIAERHRDPLARMTIGIRNISQEAVEREIGEKLNIEVPVLGVNSEFTIFGIEHTITAEGGGFVHSVLYDVERSTPQNLLILDNATFGVLDGDRILGF